MTIVLDTETTPLIDNTNQLTDFYIIRILTSNGSGKVIILSSYNTLSSKQSQSHFLDHIFPGLCKLKYATRFSDKYLLLVLKFYT